MTLAELFALQPAAVVTVTLIVTGLIAPAVYVILRVPCPELIVPLVTVQL